MSFEDVYLHALTSAKSELKTLDLNAAYSLGLSKSRSHLQGSHTVVTYPPLDSLTKVTDGSFLKELSFPEDMNAYLHIPLCDYRCTFCHYLTVHTTKTTKTNLNGMSYLEALKWEMGKWGDLLKQKKSQICSLYIGGGTPTALPTVELDSLLQYAHEALPFSITPKICVETSPKSLAGPKRNNLIDIFERYKVKRVSIGIQSFHPEALKVAGRYYNHSKTAGAEWDALAFLLDSEIENVNIDMIQDLPLEIGGSHLEVLRHDLEKIMELKPQHITWYSMRLCPESRLTFTHLDEDGRSYYRLGMSNKNFFAPSQKESLLMRLVIWRFLESIGYVFLEGDRFALKEKYEDKFRKVRGSVTSGLLGMGVSSYSHINNSFFRNIASKPSANSMEETFLSSSLNAIHNYIGKVKSEQLPIQTSHTISTGEVVAGLFALGLKRGVDIEDIIKRYGFCDESKTYLAYAMSLVNLMVAGNLLEEKCGTIEFTTLGRLFENEICQKFYSPKVSYSGYVHRGLTPPMEVSTSPF